MADSPADRVSYVAHTAHLQFLALVLGFVGWILTLTTAGLNVWRVWHVADTAVVSSGQAWVGVWRACFYSHSLARFENCRAIGIADDFTPLEIRVAQVLVMAAVACGLASNMAAAVAMRSAYFSVDTDKRDGRVFRAAGLLYLLTGSLLLVPLAWNVNAVLSGATIPFPPEFCLPAAPEYQEVGSAIGVGFFACGLLLISGTVFLCYRFPKESSAGPEAAAITNPQDPLHGAWPMSTLSTQAAAAPPRGEDGSRRGKDNPAFHTEEE